MLTLKIIATWSTIAVVIAAGQWISMNKKLRFKIAGTLILLMGFAYPVIGAMGVASAAIGNSVLKDLSTSDSLVEKYRVHLRSDSINARTKHVLSKVLAYHQFWETGELISYFDEKGTTVVYEPSKTDEILAMSAIKAKAVFHSTLSFSLLWISAVPIGLFFGYQLARSKE